MIDTEEAIEPRGANFCDAKGEMATNGQGRVLLVGSKQRSQQNPMIKPLIFGVLLGALVSQSFHMLFFGRPHVLDPSDAFEDPCAIVDAGDGAGLGASAGVKANNVGEKEVMPHSTTARGRDGGLCLECETALASKEVDMTALRAKLNECTAENLVMLEQAEFGDEERRDASTSVEDDVSLPVRKEIEVFVGIQSGFSPNTVPGDDFNYHDRRQAIRDTWLRSNDTAFSDKLAKAGVVVKFVMGRGPSEEMTARMMREKRDHGDIMTLDIDEDYHNLVFKSREFFKTVMASYSPKYIVKVDDDVYLQLNRLPMAVKQWESMRVDYTGCMKRGPVQRSPAYKWFEPQHALLGDDYFSHCWGSLYVLSGRAADAMSSIPPGILRNLENEDVTVGLFMLTANMQHYDDRRLCMDSCKQSGIGLFDLPHPGLEPVIKRMHELHNSTECKADNGSFDVDLELITPWIDFRVYEGVP